MFKKLTELKRGARAYLSQTVPMIQNRWARIDGRVALKTPPGPEPSNPLSPQKPLSSKHRSANPPDAGLRAMKACLFSLLREAHHQFNELS